MNAQSAPTDQTTQPPKALRADAQRNIERLLDAARAAIAKDGPDASLDDIARDAGVGSGTLYRHFPTRVALLEAVYREEVARLCAEGDRLLESDTEPGEALAEWLRVYVSFGAMKRGLMGPLTTALGQDSDLLLDLQDHGQGDRRPARRASPEGGHDPRGRRDQRRADARERDQPRRRVDR